MDLKFKIDQPVQGGAGNVVIENILLLHWHLPRNYEFDIGVYVFSSEGNMVEFRTQGPDYEVFSFKLLAFRDQHQPKDLSQIPRTSGRVRIEPPGEDYEARSPLRHDCVRGVYRGQATFEQKFTIGLGADFLEVRFDLRHANKCVVSDQIEWYFYDDAVVKVRIIGLEPDDILKLRKSASDPHFDEVFDPRSKSVVRRPRV